VLDDLLCTTWAASAGRVRRHRRHGTNGWTVEVKMATAAILNLIFKNSNI